jgi:hypothetical protein
MQFNTKDAKFLKKTKKDFFFALFVLFVVKILFRNERSWGLLRKGGKAARGTSV